MDKKKIVHQLDTPYSTARWPMIESADQDTILELLCTLLAPIGQYRAQHAPRSGGKRDKKRKAASRTDKKEPQTQLPPPPDLLQHVDVGLVAISRHLQNMASAPSPHETNSSSASKTASTGTPKSPYAAVFVARSGQPPILNSHIPQMIAVATQSRPDQEPIRLVGISKACEDRLSEALGIPRVSCVALRSDAPNGMPLLAFVRQHAPLVQLDWLRTAQSGQFQSTRINSIPTSIGTKKQPVKD